MGLRFARRCSFDLPTLAEIQFRDPLLARLEGIRKGSQTTFAKTIRAQERVPAAAYFTTVLETRKGSRGASVLASPCEV